MSFPSLSQFLNVWGVTPINFENLLRDGLSKLIDKVVAGEISKIVIMNRNILADKSFEFIESLCIRLGTLIEIIDSTKEGD